jgi:hypothetical protein
MTGPQFNLKPCAIAVLHSGEQQHQSKFHTNSNRECGERAGFGLSYNPTQSLIAGPGTDLLAASFPKLAASSTTAHWPRPKRSTISFRIGQTASVRHIFVGPDLGPPRLQLRTVR